MRLTILGGAAAWPNPGQGCSSYLISSGSTNIVVDCGPGTLPELRKQFDYHDVDAILLTHCHADHMLDLVPYRYGLLYGPERSGRRIPLWLPPGGAMVMERLAIALGAGEDEGSYWSEAFDLHTYNPAQHVQINEFSIGFAETQHFVPCCAMRIDAGGRSIFYSGDTGSILPLVDLARSCDLALIEGTVHTHPDGPSSIRGHLTPQDAGELAELAGARRLVITHLWSERPVQSVLEAAASTFGGPISIAEQGMIIDV